MTIPCDTVLASAAHPAAQLGHIFYFTVLPILLVAGLGYVLQRRLGLDMPTLVRLNFYFIIPAMVYVSILTSRVNVAEIGRVLGFCVAVQAGLWLLTLGAAAVRRVPRDQWRTMLMSTMLYNSGNYGLPLQDLAFKRLGFGGLAASLQIFVMLFQNVLGFTVGVFLISGGRKDAHWREQLMHIVKFPSLYAIVAALVTIQIRLWLGDDAARVASHLAPFWQAIQYVKEGFFAIALGTLGAQLATVRNDGLRYPVTLTVVLRLLAAPAVALGAIYLLGLEGLMAQVLLISTATPTAVNAMLLCLEFKNHPDFAARSVFYSTVLSPLTVTLVIFVAQGGFLQRLALP
ncbi:MAG TPA: AEC family transporter [Phycisphaerae bacterium]|nr:AEC family transporter [Phycisphaerae bacterium]HOI55256.1 AEC family transporter [Phycisphaerae bacterium]